MLCATFPVWATTAMVRPPAVAAAPSPSHCRRAAPISSAVVLSREEVAKAAWLAKQDLPLWGPAARRSSVAPRRALGSGRHSAASYLYSTMLKPKAKVRCDVADVRKTRNWRAVEEAAIARRASLSSETSEAALLDTVRSARWSWGGVWNGCRGVHVVVSVDWEGTRFNAEDLAVFRKFREDFPSVRLTHFLNAAYYTQLAPDDVRAALNATEQIRSVLREADEIGNPNPNPNPRPSPRPRPSPNPSPRPNLTPTPTPTPNYRSARARGRAPAARCWRGAQAVPELEQPARRERPQRAAQRLLRGGGAPRGGP